jgi:Caudovirus prohead serine protease
MTDDELYYGNAGFIANVKAHPEWFVATPVRRRSEPPPLRVVADEISGTCFQSLVRAIAEGLRPIMDEREAALRKEIISLRDPDIQPQQHKWLSGPFELKAIDDAGRTIEGICNSGKLDRVSEVCDPRGAFWSLPLSLLLEHQKSQPIGIVDHLAATERGLLFRASIPRVTEPPSLRDRIETAFSEIRAKLLRSVSIGFLPLASEEMANGTRKWTRYEVTEISLVQIPADPSARLIAWSDV